MGHGIWNMRSVPVRSVPMISVPSLRSHLALPADDDDHEDGNGDEDDDEDDDDEDDDAFNAEFTQFTEVNRSEKMQ